ncbi:signal transducer and activator of transcription 5A-like isoform X2 [Anneissia japonica]|uniref:signal transducer and activator of transcription 5A-like isoform X2 n=1 Tax=Anneissia japonica TaxID=1529436 RepID=UPI001425BB12|nr:signal transducer and activator of transcription 5A-like isoform X2 [Anneissia japonica]
MSLIQRLQQLQGEGLQKLQALYMNTQFPMEIRYYCAAWIEAQDWQGINVDDLNMEPNARMLLQELIQQVNQKAEGLSTDEMMFPIRLKLYQFARELDQRWSISPLSFVRTIRYCIEVEHSLVDDVGGTFSRSPMSDSHENIETTLQELRVMTADTEKDLDNLQQKQEMFVFQYQENLKLQNQLAQLQLLPERDPNRMAQEPTLKQKKQDLEGVLQSEAQRLLGMRINLADKHKRMFEKIKEVQHTVLEDELIQWKRRQQLAGIGGPPEGTLDQLQKWCEVLAEITWHNRQQIKKVELLRQQLPMNVPGNDLLPELNTTITALLSTLVTSTFIIEKQPPQVLKKETRFAASVRLLVGGKLNVHMNPPQVKATIVSEAQAKNLLNNDNLGMNETSGDILNNCGVMEYHKESGNLTVTFRNMSLKRIRRADRRGSEFVTEEKFTILFQSTFSIASGELMFQVRTMSLPVVVVSHGNQECNALATILWDNAFAESGRVPFSVPDRVLWPDMGKALNSKFMSANGRSLSLENLNYLAQKAFSGQNINTDDYSQLQISWSTFNRDPLPGRSFTFWKWFHGVQELTRKHLRGPWNDGSIMGFVSRGQAQDLLLSRPHGNFLLRFSDSEIGGVTIAWSGDDPQTGTSQVWNLQPFTGEDFNIRSLADRIQDLPHLVYLYPDIPKDTAFRSYYTPMSDQPLTTNSGYVGSVLISKIPHIPVSCQDNPATPSSSYNPGYDPQSPGSSCPPSVGSMHGDQQAMGNMQESMMNDIGSDYPGGFDEDFDFSSVSLDDYTQEYVPDIPMEVMEELLRGFGVET